MWSTPSDRAVAEAAAKRERQAREDKRTAGMSLLERLDRFLAEEPGEETEEAIDLLVAVRDDLAAKAGKS